ncbi:hypothetical protein CWT12_10745 [Actinomyces sp. 432]|uniref:hypothetical protein n=1 Tax=Actinomyces sp. 432 TaxID=2057798 RepID=UPI001373C964|nr:hypothetical protein [Actinomyces sp. 432]QHO91686.1 hypothetical protein CWT12_10745 [Actinomyces sp. 432]
MNTWNNTSLPAHERATALLAAMSRREKIHQLASFWERNEEESVPAPEPAGAGELDGQAGPADTAHQVAPWPTRSR